jgi:hypothetical protein
VAKTRESALLVWSFPNTDSFHLTHCYVVYENKTFSFANVLQDLIGEMTAPNAGCIIIQQKLGGRVGM